MPLSRKTPLRKHEKTVSQLKREVDGVFSKFIRNRDGGKCFTCDKVAPIAQMQAGHFVSRMYSSLRFDPRNVHCQCVGCNVFKHGNMSEYAARLVRKFGPEILEEFSLKKREIKQFRPPELYDLRKKYRDELKQLQT